jgi:pimeloyl-ACP methyl ester carboxylesterase
MLAGDWSGFARVVAEQRTRGRRGLAMSMSMDCASGVSPQRLERIRREARVAILGDALNVPWPEICEGWPHRDLGAAFRANFHSGVPVLFISGTLDARTPPENALDLLPGFPNGRHLVIEGGSHDDDLFLSSPLILETMSAFFAGLAPSRTRITLPPIEFTTGGRGR